MSLDSDEREGYRLPPTRRQVRARRAERRRANRPHTRVVLLRPNAQVAPLWRGMRRAAAAGNTELAKRFLLACCAISGGCLERAAEASS